MASISPPPHAAWFWWDIHRPEFVTTGDGLLATFDAPASGVRCATAIREAVRTLGLEIRVGLHAGEYKVSGADVVGLAFHVGARVAAKARAGEVLVSSAVKDDVAVCESALRIAAFTDSKARAGAVAPVPGRTLKVSCKSGHRFCDRFDSATAGADSSHGERS